MQIVVATQKPCLRAAVSRAMPRSQWDDEDRVETYASMLRPAWQQILDCQDKKGTVVTICPRTNETETLAICSTFTSCDLFALAVFSGKSFDLTLPCGKKEKFGPLVKGIFH